MISTIILAGGYSSRLGRDKSLETIAGKSLVSRAIECLSPLSTEIILVISERQWKARFDEYPAAKTVFDIYPEKGPLGGLYTGLMHSCKSRCLAVACDMPFLSRGLLHYMISLAPGFDVVMPRIDGRNEPLHAIYTKECIRPMEEKLKLDDLKIADFPDAMMTRYVENEEIKRFDPQFLSFLNINNQADLEYSRMLAVQPAFAAYQVGFDWEGGR